jgi:hypothetical protein
VIVDMKVEWFNALFKDNFEEVYDNVMNFVVDFINYNGDEDNGGDECVDDCGDTYDDDDDNNNDDNNDGDENVDSFWKQDLNYHKLAICTGEALMIYYANYVLKELCMVSYNTCMRWLNEILQEYWK